MSKTPLLIELFIWFNVSFLAIDTFFAHSANSFRLSSEWIPVYFSLAVMMIHGCSLWIGKKITEEKLSADKVGKTLGLLCIGVGLLGVFYHLNSHFFIERTLNNLIFSAPFIAPLSYTGIGFLYLINRIQFKNQVKRMQWILLTATLGILGNYVLSIFDHAQNGFFYETEWIAAFVSALGVAVLLPVSLGIFNRLQIQLSIFVIIILAFTGLAGFYFHLIGNLHKTASMWENFVFGAPIFAPLLFINFALLSLIPILKLRQIVNS